MVCEIVFSFSMYRPLGSSTMIRGAIVSHLHQSDQVGRRRRRNGPVNQIREHPGKSFIKGGLRSSFFFFQITIIRKKKIGHPREESQIIESLILFLFNLFSTHLFSKVVFF